MRAAPRLKYKILPGTEKEGICLIYTLGLLFILN